jgi:hypothetical protein
MLLMRAASIAKWEGVGPWKSRLFWAPNGTRLLARFLGPNPLPLVLVVDTAASKALRTGPYKS